jgi:large subunit ribosomal protein L9
MKVILQRDIPKVGKGGDIVNVADGYARNYLFPRQYAVAATGGALKEHQTRVNWEKNRETRVRTDAESSASKIDGAMLTLTGRVGSGTKLYGSITAQDVSDAITRSCGMTIDKRRIGLADPIKSLGTYPVPVRLHSDVVVNVTVEVVTKEELERRKAQAAAAEAAAAEAAAQPEPPAESPAPAGSDEAGGANG